MRRWIQSLACCLLTVFSSCIMDIDKELPDCLPDEVTDPIAVTANLYCNGHQIAWPEGSHIGVIMLQGATNKFAYTTPVKEYFLPDTSDYLFLPFSELQQIGRPAKGTTQDATGVYPHNLTADENLEVPFSVADQSDQQALDLILAKRTTGITEATDTVHLVFYRPLARLQFHLSLTEIAADGSSKNADTKLAGARISIDGMDASALFSLNDLSCTTSGADSIRALVAADGKSGQAIVFPRKASDKVTFTVALPAYPDTVYTFAMDPQLEISSCKTYSFDMHLAYRYDSDKPGPGPDPDPAIEHHIDYVFEGDANSSNTDVFKNGTSTAWPLNEIITVDDHGSFIFSYDSDLAVSIRTKDGKVIPLNPNTSYTFTDITGDITIIISAKHTEDPGPGPAPDPDPDPDPNPTPDPDPSIKHHIDYIFEKDANSSNVDVYKNGTTTRWPLNEIITVDDHGNFTFSYDSNLNVAIRTKDGKVISLSPKTSYTFTDITSDLTIVISATKSGEPSPGIYYTVTYQFKGDASSDNMTVTQTGAAWPTDKTYTVNPGDNFTFSCVPSEEVELVSITLDDNTKMELNSGNSYTISKINRNIVITIDGKKTPELSGDAGKKGDIISAEVTPWEEIPVIDDTINKD
ncbi:MAG: hypothetical protein LUH01_03750 [Parabacteroides gordonii]|nr:hypothetical protein [Parabacteroides gordonii]